MEPVNNFQIFINKLNFYNSKDPLNLSDIEKNFENMTYLELCEASRQIETKLENIKTQYSNSDIIKLKLHSLFLLHLYTQIMGKVDSMIPKNYFDPVEIDCSGPLDYPFSEDFEGIEYEAYLQLFPYLKQINELPKEDFCSEMEKILDPSWGTITPDGFVVTEKIEENRKILISSIYDISPHKTLLKEFCRYVQETHPNERSLAFVKFLVSWLKAKKEQMESELPQRISPCSCELIGGCEDCLKPLVKTHSSYQDCKIEECEICSIRDCPHGVIEHYFHDGCPVCFSAK